MCCAPYLMGAAMSGAATVRGFEVDVDLSASDIFSNLQFGAMGLVVARKGGWGVASDSIWMALGTTVRNTNVDVNHVATHRSTITTAARSTMTRLISQRSPLPPHVTPVNDVVNSDTVSPTEEMMAKALPERSGRAFVIPRRRRPAPRRGRSWTG